MTIMLLMKFIWNKPLLLDHASLYEIHYHSYIIEVAFTLYNSGPQSFYCCGSVNVWHYFCESGSGCIPPWKLDGAYIFTTMLRYDTMTIVVSSKSTPFVTRNQLINEPALDRSPRDGDYCSIWHGMTHRLPSKFSNLSVYLTFCRICHYTELQMPMLQC